MRYAKQISTGLLIDGQGGGNPDNPAHLKTLKDNAISFGFPENDIEVGYCTDIELEEMLKVKNDLLKTYSDFRKAEYPSIEECVHAILDNELDTLQVKRQAIKKKYPKGAN